MLQFQHWFGCNAGNFAPVGILSTQETASSTLLSCHIPPFLYGASCLEEFVPTSSALKKCIVIPLQAWLGSFKLIRRLKPTFPKHRWHKMENAFLEYQDRTYKICVVFFRWRRSCLNKQFCFEVFLNYKLFCSEEKQAHFYKELWNPHNTNQFCVSNDISKANMIETGDWKLIASNKKMPHFLLSMPVWSSMCGHARVRICACVLTCSCTLFAWGRVRWCNSVAFISCQPAVSAGGRAQKKTRSCVSQR